MDVGHFFCDAASAAGRHGWMLSDNAVIEGESQMKI